MIVVHGGGKQMTRYLAERGIESRFVNGLRVTTPEVLDAVLKVFAGSVNHELVAALIARARARWGFAASMAGWWRPSRWTRRWARGARDAGGCGAARHVAGGRIPAGGGVRGGRPGRAVYTTSMRIRWRWPARRRSARSN